MENKIKNFLLIGYGNPGRLDDGLGPALAGQIDEMGLPGLDVEVDYQLNIEHAEQLAQYGVVIFADADTAGHEPFWVRRIEAQPEKVNYSSHSMKPEAVLAVSRDLFDAGCQAFLLGIRGYDFNEYEEKLSPKARANLAKAIEYVTASVKNGRFEEINPGETIAS